MRDSCSIGVGLGRAALWLAVSLAAASCATGFVDQGDVGGGDADGVDGTSEGTGDGPDVDPDVVEGGDGEPEDGGAEDGEEATVCGPPGACDDGVPCTEDSCDEGTARCVHEPRASLCDDGNPCTGAEVCDVVLDCIAGTPVDCDDDAACTDDACLPATGACDHVVNCTAPQVCDPVGGNCADPSSCTVDADCNDGNFCTGVETCESAWRCRPGTPPACDDGLACSADRCDPAAAGGAGACVADSPDLDGDLHGSAACLGDDCNDGDASVHPGASEACNAVDDDCDGSTDETFACPRGGSGACTVGACTGVRTCSASCTWGTCTVSATETCNGLDDDCDGVADEGFGCVRGATRSCTLGACSGTQTCGTACSWGTCTVSTPESCNGLDDNCNGAVDETFSCSLGSTGGCTNSCGAAGSRTCTAPACSWGTCCGPIEVCGNTCDDDCDGAVNEGCTTTWRILVLLELCSGVDHVTAALTNLGYYSMATIVGTGTELYTRLISGTWDLVIVDEYSSSIDSLTMDQLNSHVLAGRKLIFAHWDLSSHPTHALLTRAGVTLGASYTSPPPIYRWITSPLFTTPNAVPNISGYTDTCNTDGQYLTTTTATAYAGYTLSPLGGQAALTVSSDSRVILNAFMPQIVTQNADFDAKQDMVELYENEIDFLL